MPVCHNLEPDDRHRNKYNAANSENNNPPEEEIYRLAEQLRLERPEQPESAEIRTGAIKVYRESGRRGERFAFQRVK